MVFFHNHDHFIYTPIQQRDGGTRRGTLQSVRGEGSGDRARRRGQVGKGEGRDEKKCRNRRTIRGKEMERATGGEGERERGEEGRRGRGERREDEEKMKSGMCGCGFEFPGFFCS